MSDMLRRIYMDYASATPVCDAAASATAEAAAIFGNPSSIHTEGVQASRALERARESIAAEIGCKAREIVFTSGGTEANNLAILGYARMLALRNPRGDIFATRKATPYGSRDLLGTHWIVSAIEHPSVLECFAEIERLGGAITHIDPDSHGLISPESVSRALRPETVFVSIGWGNGEIGTIQPIAQIAHMIRKFEENTDPKGDALRIRKASPFGSRIIFHTDVGQVPLYRPLQVHSLGVDLLTLDSGKLYGPRGVGVLYVGKGVELAPIILGGKQERGLRAGTENVALAAGFAAALTHVAGERVSESKRLQRMRDDFARDIVTHIPSAIINGDLTHAMPHVLNISIPHIQSEYVVLSLDHHGISIATKSACREGEESRSHVVEALGGESWRSQNTLRFSLGSSTTKDDLMKVMHMLTKIIVM
jgi:cysteine desulfurase